MFLITAYSFHSIIYSITDMLTSHDLDVGNSTLLGAFLTQRNGWLDHCRHVEASHGTPKNDLGNDSSIGYLMFVSFRSKFLGLQPLLLLLFSFLAIHCCTATWLKRKQGQTPVHKHVYTLWLTTIALVKHFELLRVRGIVSHSWCFSSCNVRRCYHRVESSFPNGTEFRTVILIYCRHIYERREPYEIKHIFVENHAECLSWVS